MDSAFNKMIPPLTVGIIQTSLRTVSLPSKADMSAEATPSQPDFFILLPDEQVQSVRTSLQSHLAGRFPMLTFRIGVDVAGLSGGRGYYVMPLRASRTDADLKADGVIPKTNPQADALKQLHRAISEFFRLVGSGA